ncbi:hypothetical protein MCANUFG1_02186 [Mycoplasmopsis canis UFG1]|uniref:hypothetical protein n=1 Tax=Mycoplasmopsis canis TaxID=29555 RepID=UPI00025B0132|nr:hypothetical protein [Mycoplasmopsis canis]EIE41645.1 hypothetical protein MCANUFG1_02186 [Mycoplasmopsis canis UFG1]
MLIGHSDEGEEGVFISPNSLEIAIDKIFEHVQRFVIRDESDTTRVNPNNPNSPIINESNKFYYLRKFKN